MLRYGSGDITRTLVIPEIGLSASIPLSDLSLLISAGGGVSLTAQGPGETQGTFFTSVALDIPTGGALSLRPAGRIRWVGPWAGTVADLTVGISYRLGRGRRADR